MMKYITPFFTSALIIPLSKDYHLIFFKKLGKRFGDQIILQRLKVSPQILFMISKETGTSSMEMSNGYHSIISKVTILTLSIMSQTEVVCF